MLVPRDVVGRHITGEGGASQAAEKRNNTVILSPFAVILSVAKNLALLAQGKLREGSRSECFQGRARFFIADAPQNDSRAWSFSATCEAFFQSGEKDD